MSNTIDHNGIFQGNQVNPATTAFTASDRSELMTKLANLVTNLVVQLCWEWTAADTGTISFEDTINLTDAAWSDTQTGAATRADRIR